MQLRSVWSEKHDFTTFRSTECQAKSPVKTLDVLKVERAGEDIYVTSVARSFLHNQVRSMVGSLVLVGEGKWSPTTSRKRSVHAIVRPAALSRRRTGCIS